MSNENAVRSSPTESSNSNEDNLEKEKLREQRRLRNNEKKLRKKLRKQVENEQKQLMLKLQVRNNNVAIISKDLADKLVGNQTGTVRNELDDSAHNFPALGEGYKRHPKREEPSSSHISVKNDSTDKKSHSKLQLVNFLSKPPILNNDSKSNNQKFEPYEGNPLDSDKPVRKRGKLREIPKKKRVCKVQPNAVSETDSENVNTDPVEVILCDNLVTEELNNHVTVFLTSLVKLQEKLYKRDPIKGKFKRRLVVGLHEVRKHVNFNKVKLIIMPPDIKLNNGDDKSRKIIQEIINSAKSKNIPYVFALKRRSLGSITLKKVPVLCIGVLNYEGLENHFSEVEKLVPLMKQQFQKEEHSLGKNISVEDITKECSAGEGTIQSSFSTVVMEDSSSDKSSDDATEK